MGIDYSVDHAAELAAQLPTDSRCSRKVHPEHEWSVAEYMLASIEYGIAFIAWTKTEDAKRKTNRPKPRMTPVEAAKMAHKLESTNTDSIDRLLGY